MKTYRHNSRGIALVIVLGFLVIISALAVAFFSSVTTELKASRNFASGITTRQLSESAVNAVMGQIRNATSVQSSTWASQPGVIRTYGSGTAASPDPLGIYKLYSSSNMVVSANQLAGNFTDPANNPYKDLDNNWDKSPALWVDLNSPVGVSDPTNPAQTVQRFPIIDPRAYAQQVGDQFTDSDANVEGFWYDSNSSVNGIVGPSAGANSQRLPMPVRWIYVLQDGSLTCPDGGNGTTATWSGGLSLVPKKDNPIVGRIAFWTDDDTSKVNLNTAGGFIDPSRDANLVSTGYDVHSYAGSFWDTPRFFSEFDRGMPYAESLQSPKAGTPVPGKGGLAIAQLLQGEYQRYPGHPATTSLGIVFGKSISSEQLYSILPRFGTTNSKGLTPGSSVGGTMRVVIGTTGPDPKPDDLMVQPKGDRLYASVDELLFAATNKSKVVTNTSYTRATNDAVLKSSYGIDKVVTPEMVEKLRFFLTAHSRSPELNLFGRPRISVWPIRFETSTETSGLNPFDNVILFCSTVGSAPTTSNNRPNTMSAPSAAQTPLQTAKINPPPTVAAMPYRYIFTRRELPAATATANSSASPLLPTPATTWSSAATWLPDIDQPRNKQLMVYLQNMTSARIPGFSANSSDTFANKWGDNNRDALLVEIFDYIRNANVRDTTTTIGNTAAIKFSDRGLVMPSKASYLQTSKKFSGLGRFPVISEVSLVFYYSGPTFATADVPADPVAGTPQQYAGKVEMAYIEPQKTVDDPRQPLNLPDTNPRKGRKRVVPKNRTMRAFLLFSTFNPMQGYAPVGDPVQADPKVELVVDKMSSMRISYLNPDSATPNVAIESSLGFPSGPQTLTINKSSGGTWGGRNFGGYEGFMHTLAGTPDITGSTTAWPANKIKAAPNTALTPPYNIKGLSNSPSPSDQYLNQEFYPFQSVHATPVAQLPGLMQGIILPWKVTSFNFIAPDPLEVTVKYGGVVVQQKLKIKFENSAGWKVPEGAPPPYPVDDPRDGTMPRDIWTTDANDADWTNWETNLRDVNRWLTFYGFSMDADKGAKKAYLPGNTNMKKLYWTDNGSFYPAFQREPTPPDTAPIKPAGTVWYYQTRLSAAWSFASRLAWSMQMSGVYANPPAVVQNDYGTRWRQIVQPGDTIRSLIYVERLGNTNATKATSTGDLRLAPGLGDPSLADGETYPLYPHPDYDNGALNRACLLRMADGQVYFPPRTATTPIADNYSPWDGNSGAPSPTGWNTATFGNHVQLGGGKRFPANRAFGTLPISGGNNGGIDGIIRNDGAPGDFDTGVGSFPDGAFANKQDEGNVIYAWFDAVANMWRFPVPYYGTWQYEPAGNTFTSPNRQMPSPVMMGSLPTRPTDKGANGPINNWETLSFSPVPAGTNHPGNQGLKDHLLLDLFQMPVVEPYPISEPFSTAGKINMNYQILPFTYVTRSTGMRAALHALRVTAVGKTEYDKYKTGIPSAGDTTTATAYDREKGQNRPVTSEYRYPVDRNETLKAFDAFFKDGENDASKGIYKSATEICERFLYPLGADVKYGAGENTIKNWWYDSATAKALGGDNTREKPYADLYPRLTTKSNTYTVHMRVQTLQQLPKTTAAAYATWQDGKDRVLGEYRGSTTIERYIDPADVRFDPSNANFAKPDDITAPNLEGLYRFRSIENKKFAP